MEKRPVNKLLDFIIGTLGLLGLLIQAIRNGDNHISWWSFFLGWFAAGAAIIVIVVSCVLAFTAAVDEGLEETSTPKTPLESTPRPAITITAEQLSREFEANEVRANAQYEGQWVRVTGTVESIEEDIFEDEMLKLEGGLWGVSCDYNDETDSAKAQRLNIGDRVTVLGQIDDYLLGVSIKHCEILP